MTSIPGTPALTASERELFESGGAEPCAEASAHTQPIPAAGQAAAHPLVEYFSAVSRRRVAHARQTAERIADEIRVLIAEMDEAAQSPAQRDDLDCQRLFGELLTAAQRLALKCVSSSLAFAYEHLARAPFFRQCQICFRHAAGGAEITHETECWVGRVERLINHVLESEVPSNAAPVGLGGAEQPETVAPAAAMGTINRQCGRCRQKNIAWIPSSARFKLRDMKANQCATVSVERGTSLWTHMCSDLTQRLVNDALTSAPETAPDAPALLKLEDGDVEDLRQFAALETDRNKLLIRLMFLARTKVARDLRTSYCGECGGYLGINGHAKTCLTGEILQVLRGLCSLTGETLPSSVDASACGGVL